MAIRYYTTTLMYTNFYGNTDAERRYRKGVMSMKEKTFHTYPVHILINVRDSSGKLIHACLVPVQLNPFALAILVLLGTWKDIRLQKQCDSHTGERKT